MAGKPIHGDAREGRVASEHRIWAGMIQRCHNPRNPGYHRYGGRGIRVCKRWRDSYVDFLADMGRRPSKEHSLDRINNNGPYSPENCRWATKKQQSRNTRVNRRLTVDGRTLSIAEWSDLSGVKPATINTRRIRGWSAKEAVWRPAQKKRRGSVPTSPPKPRTTLTADGRTQDVPAWASEVGWSESTIYRRIRWGWSDHDCVFGRERSHRGRETNTLQAYVEGL